MGDSQDSEDIHVVDESNYVNDVVKAILILDHSKKSFKQSDISRFLLNKPKSRMWTSILDSARERLRGLGLDLVEKGNSKSKSYFLISNIFPFKSMYKFAPESEVADRILIVIVLAYLFFKEKPMPEIDVLNHLENFRIYNKDKPIHEYFGDVKKKVLTDFVSQMYLEKEVHKDVDVTTLKWGDRAEAEISKKSILEFICQIGCAGSIQPQRLVSLYHKVEEEENALRSKQPNYSQESGSSQH